MTQHARQAERTRSSGFGLQGLVVSLMVLAAMIGIAWVYMGMITRDRWPIRWLELDGAFKHVSAEQLRTRLAPLVTGSFFTVNMDAVQAVTRQTPWVDEVFVHKTWPDTVRVRVSEYVPLAHWTDGRLMAQGAAVFRVPGGQEMQGLPWLEGPEGSEELVFEKWQAFNGKLAEAGLEIQRIRLDARGAWYLELARGTRVHLGREDAEQRLQRFVDSWPALLAHAQRLPANVDLRYSNGFAVRWPEPAPEGERNPG